MLIPKALLLSILENMVIVTTNGGQRHMECISDVHSFAAKAEAILMSKLGTDLNPTSARFNIIVCEIVKSMDLVKMWSGIVRRATTDQASHLTRLEEFKFMTSFTQRYCKIFIEKQNEVSYMRCRLVLTQQAAGIKSLLLEPKRSSGSLLSFPGLKAQECTSALDDGQGQGAV